MRRPLLTGTELRMTGNRPILKHTRTSLSRWRAWPRCGLCLVATAALALVGASPGRAAAPSPSDGAREAAKAALGERLFNDAMLSADGSISCASCHQPKMAFSDARRVAIGVAHQAGTRNTPSLVTLGRSGNTTYFWDGRRPTLETAVLDPFTNPVEMGLANQTDLLHRLQGATQYQALLHAAFPDASGSLALPHIARALATYIRSLDQHVSPYDHFVRDKDEHALSAQAQRGMAIFEGKGRCAECHITRGSPAPLTDHAYHRTGIGMSDIEKDLPALTMGVIQRSLQDEALGNRIATHAPEAQLGRFNVTHNVEDIGLFRTPSLRGVAQTAPYMHDGSVATLPEAVEMEIYYRSLTSGHPIGLTVQEKAELLEFLKQL